MPFPPLPPRWSERTCGGWKARVGHREEAVYTETQNHDGEALVPDAHSCWAGPSTLTCQLHLCNICEREKHFYLVNASGIWSVPIRRGTYYH